MNELLLHYQKSTYINDDMSYKDAAINQEIFMRDVIGLLLKAHVFKISSHTSKSISLPVYGIAMRNGVKIIARDNFYGWVMSVELPAGLPDDYLDLDMFDGKLEKISPCYCEGFKPEWVYGTYEPKNKTCTKFTVRVEDRYKMYLILYMLNKAFPDMSFEDDGRNDDELTASVYRILATNGRYTFDGVGQEEMKGWEIMYFTYYFINDILMKNGSYGNAYIFQYPESIVEAVRKYPEVYQIFRMEEYMFKTIF